MDMHFILRGVAAPSASKVINDFEVVKVTEVAEVAEVTTPPVTKVTDVVIDIDKVTVECAGLIALSAAAAADAKILTAECAGLEEEVAFILYPSEVAFILYPSKVGHVCVRACVQMLEQEMACFAQTLRNVKKWAKFEKVRLPPPSPSRAPAPLALPAAGVICLLGCSA